MKKLLLSGVALVLFSCTADEEQVTEAHDFSIAARGGVYPGNPGNYYDMAGLLHNEISEAFLQSGDTVSTTAGILAAAETLANQNADFLSIKPFDYVSPTSFRINEILDDDDAFDDIVDDTALSATAKASLTTFADSLMVLRAVGADYDLEIYPYIINYEQDLLVSSTFTATELEVLLTTTSIARYAFYFAKTHRRKPRDRDWDISIGNIAAGIEGVADSQAKAVMMATVAGLKFNK